MVAGREANLVLMLDIFQGDVFAALNKAREHNKLTITMSAMSLERLVIELLLNIGWTEIQISAAISTEKRVVGIGRVRRIKNEIVERKEDGS